ncbi:MAG: hypothetical protein IJJ33_07230 [Victivallales bacterium]|nr:hypothetical protein [Victivallales bacterium]
MPDDEHDIAHFLAGLRRLTARWTLVRAALLGGWLAIPCMAVPVLAALLDRLAPLSSGGRMASLVFALLFWCVSLAWVLRLTWRKPSLVSTALAVENVRPQADNCLVNAVLFAQKGEHSPKLIAELLQESQVDLSQVAVTELLPRRSLKWLRLALPCAILLCALPFLLSPIGMGTSLLRILRPFSDIQPYTHTRIALLSPGDTTLRRGASAELHLETTGTSPKKVVVELEDAGLVTLEMAPIPMLSNAFGVTTPPLYGEARYRVKAGDATSPWHTLRILPPPALKRWEMAVAPPLHTGIGNFLLHSMDEQTTIPQFSTLLLAGEATEPLASAQLLQNGKPLVQTTSLDSPNFELKLQLTGNDPLTLNVKTKDGELAEFPIPVTIRPDQPPSIALIDVPLSQTLERGATFSAAFRAQDDYGISRCGLELLKDGSKGEDSSIASPTQPTRAFTGRFLVDTGTFQPPAEQNTLRFRIWTEDNAPQPQRSNSAVFAVQFPPPQEKKAERDQNKSRQAEENLAGIIKAQRLAIKDTSQLQNQASHGQTVPPSSLERSQHAQAEVRSLSVKLLESQQLTGLPAHTLAGLVNVEMKQVLEQFSEAFRVDATHLSATLNNISTLQRQILTALTGSASAVSQEQVQQGRNDVFARLQSLIKRQRTALKDTEDASQGRELAHAALVQNLDRIAQDILVFSNLCLEQSSANDADDFQKLLRQAHRLLSESQCYETALEASESVDAKDWKQAISSERNVLAGLLRALDLLNKWRTENAKKIVKDALETLRETKTALEGMEKTQARIAEIARDLAKRGVLDDDAREKLAELAREQKPMADLLEKLANDLYQFPELPVCNELNAKMRAVFEDVMQAKDSENLANVEIAVQKEDAILDAIRSTKERIEDVEMWLPDVPDHFTWNMESFDTDEFPDMPLVPLPDELEDLVGELLDQDQQIDAESQDTTGNNMIADAEMGWAVMDGPMPSFSAKGKSGNTRPNDNEMTGRSGAGREGESNGELVENHVNGYEGRETHARRTQDKFQKGHVTEDENTTLKARATGGGKLGGESESQGMFGNAPRRDVNAPAHGKSPRQLRQETEALYASARLLYLNSGGLGEAAHELRAVENAPPDLRSLGGVKRRILRRLEDTQVSLKEGVVLPMPVSAISQGGGEATDDVDWSKLPDEYRSAISDYYRSLAQ